MGLRTIKKLYEETKMNIDKCEDCKCNCHCNVKDHPNFKGVCPCENCKCKNLEDSEKTT